MPIRVINLGNAGGGGGTVTGAENGLVLAGTVVRLGGALILDTTITTTGFLLTMAGGGATLLIDSPDNKILMQAFNAPLGEFIVQVDGNNGGADIFFQNPATDQLGLFINHAGTFATFADDINSFGLSYRASYKANGILNPLWLAEWGAIQDNFPQVVGKAHALTISVTTTIITINTELAKLGAYRLSFYLFASITAGGTIKLQVTFTDQNFTVQTVDFGLPLAATGNATYAPLPILCQVNTTITVTALVVGIGVNASAGGIIEEMLAY